MTPDEIITNQTPVATVVETKKSDNELIREHLFLLTEYIIKQTENGKTRCRIIEWNICGDGFMIKRVQRKNGKIDFDFDSYADGVCESLANTRNLEYIFNLFRDKVF